MAEPASRRRWGGESPFWYVGMAAYGVIFAIAVDDLLRSDHSVALRAPALVGAAVFTAIFLSFAFSRPVDQRPGAARWLIVLAAIALGLSFLVPTQLLFLATVGALSGLYLPPRQAVLAIAAITVTIGAFTLSTNAASAAIGSSAQVAAVCFFCYGWARLEQANAALDTARGEVARLAVADERVRFARDLHDLLGHTLSVVRVKSELAARLVDVDSMRAKEEMLEVEHVARAALAEVRETVSGYRPNLGTELENADATLRGLGIDATIDGDGRDVSGPAGETLAWVVREATTNVVRHSRARHCSIQVVREGDRICMEIGDDGHARNAETADGTGLRGIRERVAAVGGDVSVGTGPGGGFHLRVTVPVASV